MIVRLSMARFVLGVVAAAVGERTTVAATTDGEGAGGAPIAGAKQVAAAFGTTPAVAAQPLDLQLQPPRPPERGLMRGDRLAVPVGESLATNLVIMEWNRTVGDASWAEVTASSVGRNIRSAWVLDDDGFWVNQFGHSYQGTWAFTAARSSGIGFWGSAPFAVGSSALWELAGETTPASINDQVTTSVAGVVFGEILYRFAGALRAEGGDFNEVLASVLAPIGALNRQLLGTSQTIRAPPSRWRLGAGAAAYGAPDPSRGRPVAYGAVSFTYGLPGGDGLEIDEPFDHFVVDLAWTASSDPAASLLARGLLAGATFDADRARGLWGAYLSFDFDTPPRHRISTSALGFGGSARAELGAGLALEGDAIASAVLLGAGGSIPRVPGGAGRDYRYGPGQQALLGVRLLVGSRVTAGIELRQYLLLCANGETGTEQLLHGTASASVRLFGASGIGLELSRYLRRAEVQGATVRETDSAMRVYFMLRGGA